MEMVFITLLSDFGTVDGFVGAMKGVILGIAPRATILDLTHEIPAQDIRAGAWALREAAPHFPRGTIHVAVVDPGVGTPRRPIALRAGGHWYIGPDNGLLTLAAADASSGVLLEQPGFRRSTVSNTFHGRDIFAPAAGHLAAGVDPAELGPALSEWERLSMPEPTVAPGQISGHVIHVDRFGNLITNIRSCDLAGGDGWQVSWQGKAIGAVRRTFGDVAPGQWVAYPGSSGLLEIGVRDGRAAPREVEPVILSEVTACAG